ncbi:preprotein translocase subunit SecG [Aliikangiella sp. G2MR2-5]|uniref:preprotein translocase subunit SecG n=1 Tax=Aliikangiella sp. G2MR2-5 TaxID=2788943 RepID=UPI0018A95369|nr:preprotein translocase subunit SecG [Aliikangiella sp. G2MR2-5]
MEIILIIYLVVSIALIGIILLQQGKGAEMGASFGAGGANTVFGAAGSGNVLTKTTTILAILFFAIALGISYMNSTGDEAKDAVLDTAPVVEEQTAEKSIESQLPVEQGGIESEVAPMAEKKTESVSESEAVEKLEAEAKKLSEDTTKAAEETKEEVKDKEDGNN